MRWYICSFSSFLTKANVCTSHRYCLKPFKWSLAKASKGGCIKGAKGTSFVSTIVQYKCKFVASFRSSWLRVGFTLKLFSKGPNLYLKDAISTFKWRLYLRNVISWAVDLPQTEPSCVLSWGDCYSLDLINRYCNTKAIIVI